MTPAARLLRSIARSPILWGALLSVVFFALVHFGPLGHPLILRYFAGHWVEYTEVVMFFIALSALIIKLVDAAGQLHTAREITLGPKGRSLRADAVCPPLLDQLDALPAARQGQFLVQRLRRALEIVWQRGSAEGLEDDLRLLAEDDAARMYASYGLFRVVIWAIPILGFLGTVIGITEAIANLSPQELSAVAQTAADAVAKTASGAAASDSLGKVTAGLGVAFDTTTLALSLSIVLMSLQFFVDQSESQLLSEVESRATKELAGRFERLPPGPEGNVAAVEQMADGVLAAIEDVVRRQAELWQASMDSAAARWQQMGDTAGGRLQSALAAALGDSLKGHAQQLAVQQQTLGQQTAQHWSQLLQAQTHSAEQLAALRGGLAREIEVLQKAVAATGEVAQLEATLNKNLAALAGAKHFEQTVVSLAAAVNLLSARLADAPPNAAVRLEPGKRNAMAA